MKPRKPPAPNGPVLTDAELQSALRGLQETSPPPAMVAKVMRAVNEPAPASLWTWLLRPRRWELRVSPASLLATAGVVTLLAWAGLRTLPQSPPLPSASQGGAEAPVVLVRFVIKAEGARRVAIAGDFNGWDVEATPLHTQGEGDVFAVTLPLAPGATYQYKFWVDGAWITDPAAERRPDGFGQQNSVLRL